ncbi:S24 family peptidase [Flavobacterium sp. LS1R49]|uniref:S24 family peptidase n=1 Tax=Flavobacterium shii TaxID=2987687 RepID=A0A9X2ZC73_9FLAO|nr:S24 family peptidase [Flavobacterium shii]MCV9926640.1 S24 family peptidase [Flavobacterium shii]
MIVNRILQLIKYKGINKRKFYLETGLSNGYLDKVKDVGVSKIEHILNTYPDVNSEWLITGRGNMIIKPFPIGEELDIENALVQEPNSIYKVKTQKQQVPLYDVEAPAGIVSLFKDSSQAALDYISIPNLPKCDGAIYVNGDSMYPLLKSGDIIMYKKINIAAENIFWGEMYLVSLTTDDLEEFVMVKWAQKSDKGDDWIKLVSENPQHQPKDVNFKNIKGLALIKATVRINATY